MSETPAHRRAKNRAAGSGGTTEATLRGNQRLDALTKGGVRATEVERSGSTGGLDAAANRLKQSDAPQKVLQVPQKDMACLSGYHPHPLYVVCLLGLQARAGAGALRRRSG